MAALLCGAAAPAAAQSGESSKAAALTLVLALVLFMFLARALLPVYIYFDAEKRDYNPIVWIALVVFFGVIPFFVYLAVRPKTPLPRPVYCYSYQWGPPAPYPAWPYAAPYPYTHPYPAQPPAAPADRRCRFCGVRLAPPDVRCPSCGLKPR
jgi:hypothetical protein